MNPADILRSVSKGFSAASAAFPPLGLAALGIDLIAEIVEAGDNPVVIVAELRAVLPFVRAIMQRREQLIKEKFPKP